MEGGGGEGGFFLEYFSDPFMRAKVETRDR
jgi:hypothetical protein